MFVAVVPPEEVVEDLEAFLSARREAGVIERSMVAGQTHQNLRLDEVEARYPGVLNSILAVVPADA